MYYLWPTPHWLRWHFLFLLYRRFHPGLDPLSINNSIYRFMTWNVSRYNTEIGIYIYFLSLPEFTIWAELVKKLGKVRMSTMKVGSIRFILTGSSNTYKQFFKVLLKFIRSWLSSSFSAWNKWYSSTNNYYYSSSYVELIFWIVLRCSIQILRFFVKLNTCL